MKTYGRGEVYLHHSYPSQQIDVSGQLYTPATLSPGKNPSVRTVQEAD
jgi:hypothetical protein